MIPQPRNSTMLKRARHTLSLTLANKSEIESCLLNSARKSNQDITANNLYSFSSFDVIQSEGDKVEEYSKLLLYSKNFIVKNKFNAKLYYRKVIHLSNIDQHKATEIEAEIKVLEKLNHKNILKVYAYRKQYNNTIEVIQDYSSKGTLNDFLEKKVILNEVNAFYIFLQLLNGVSYLHASNYILHGEMTVHNIKLTQHGRIIIDSKLYLYNEKIKYQFYEPKEDFFSLGIILARMTKGFNEDIPVSKECKDLINLLIENERLIGIQDIYETLWMKKYLNDPQKVIISQFHEFTSEKTVELKMKFKNEENKKSIIDYTNQKPRKSAYPSIKSSYSYFMGSHRKNTQSINNKKEVLSVINS